VPQTPSRRDRPMFKNRSRALLLFLLTFTVAACGGGESPVAPTPQYARGTSTLSGPPIAARSSICTTFNNARAGAVSAGVSPPSLRVTVAAGTCSAPGQILGEKDGEVANAEAPAGPNHVTLSNQSDVAVSWSLTITHWF